VARDFHVTSDLAEAAELSRLAPSNPFCTPAFIDSFRMLGWQARLFFVRDENAPVAGCAGLLKAAPGNTALEVASLPEQPDPDVFWRGLLAWCTAAGVRTLNVQGCASAPFAAPAAAAAIERRLEYRVRLDAVTDAAAWPTHRQLIEEARRCGVQVTRQAEPGAVAAHVRLARQTWEVHPGLETPSCHSVSRRIVHALLATGAAQLHVARRAGSIDASALLLLSPAGACLHSVGVERSAASTGAAHLLLAQIVHELRDRGIRQLTLGDAEESHALVETLIAGFSNERVLQESARFTFGPGWKRRVGTLVRLARERPAGLFPALLGQMERYVAYQTRPLGLPAPEARDAIRLEPLDLAQLESLSERFPDATRHRDRARSLGYCTAFGLFLDGELAHISWLVTALEDPRNPIRNVWLRPGEAEIGPCSTFPAYRGRGLYARVIRKLCRIAADRGVERVFMITSSRNLPSQRGIEKAGLQRCGSIYRFVFPLLGGRTLTLRGHRWRPALRTGARPQPAESA